MTSLVLFGAGASHGCGGNENPPLGSQLFERLRSEGGEWAAADLSSRFENNDFEVAMAKLLQDEQQAIAAAMRYRKAFEWNAGVLPARSTVLQWEMAQFFFRFALPAESLYCRFVERAQSALLAGTLRLATLNYDRLLFQALEGMSLPFRVIGDDDPPARICLPHGSAALGAPAKLGSSGALELPLKGHVELVPGPSGGFISYGSVSYCSKIEDLERARSDNWLPPVMSFVEPTKGSPTASNYIVEERTRLTRWILEAARIALVGVRVHDLDKHIWAPLAATSATLLYVGGDDAIGFNSWARSSRSGHLDPEAYPRFWEDSFDEVLAFLDPVGSEDPAARPASRLGGSKPPHPDDDKVNHPDCCGSKRCNNQCKDP